MIPAVSNSDLNITGRNQIAMNRFDNICLSDFYKICCAAQSVDLVVQSLLSGAMK